MQHRRGISELYASLILLIIISSMGTILYSYAIETALNYEENIIHQEEIKSKKLMEKYSIIYIKWNNDTERFKISIFNYGTYDIEIGEIYINNEIVKSNSDNKDIKIESYQIKEISINTTIKIMDNVLYEILVTTKNGSTKNFKWSKLL
jgi:hypothetical protein